MEDTKQVLFSNRPLTGIIDERSVTTSTLERLHIMNTSIQAEPLDNAVSPAIRTERTRKPTGGRRTPKAGFYARSGIHVSRTKRTVEPITEEEHQDRPEYVPAPITLATTTKSEITDEMVGLPYDPAAQEAAVAYILMATAFRSHKAEKAALALRRASRAPIVVRFARPADNRVEKAEAIDDIVEGLVLAEQDRRFEGMPI